jgi:hypothetical protein
MTTAPVTVEVPAKVAEALAPLEGALAADDVAFEHVLRWSVHEVHDELWKLAEDADQPGPQALRQLAARLVVLADAYEAVKS